MSYYKALAYLENVCKSAPDIGRLCGYAAEMYKLDPEAIALLATDFNRRLGGKLTEDDIKNIAARHGVVPPTPEQQLIARNKAELRAQHLRHKRRRKARAGEPKG